MQRRAGPSAAGADAVCLGRLLPPTVAGMRRCGRRLGGRRLGGPIVIVASGIVVAVVLAACTRGADAGRGSAPAATPGAAAAAPTHSGHPTPADPAAAPLRAGERLTTLRMPRPFTPVAPAGATDEDRCFLADPKLRARAYVTGSQFLPQNAAIIHHAIFYRVAPAEVSQARALDAAEPGDGWTCFGGGTGISAAGGPIRQLEDAAWLAAWAPGGGERLTPAGTGFPMEPGSQVVMQMHYNLLTTAGRPAGSDQSAIRLRLMDGAARLTALRTTLLPAPVELPCAPGESGRLCDRDAAVLDLMRRFGSQAGAAVAGLRLLCGGGWRAVAGSVQHCDRTIREAGIVYAVAGHMHLLGRSITVELNPGTPRARTLLNVPVYNFHDQGIQVLRRPVTVRPGDTYRVTCTHDATLRRQLPELRRLPPRYVVWGDGTSDEMCLGIVIWAPAPA
jgi:Copper type II ascorbate-dependent monooxygenase, C-terminal domain